MHRHTLSPVKQMHHHGSGRQLCDGEEELMVPLAIEVIVPVIEVGPPGVVVRIDA